MLEILNYCITNQAKLNPCGLTCQLRKSNELTIHEGRLERGTVAFCIFLLYFTSCRHIYVKCFHSSFLCTIEKNNRQQKVENLVTFCYILDQFYILICFRHCH